MTVSIDQRLACLELATRCTTNNKTAAMEVAREFIAFLQEDAPKEHADKPKVSKPAPRKTAGKTAASKAA